MNEGSPKASELIKECRVSRSKKSKEGGSRASPSAAATSGCDEWTSVILVMEWYGKAVLEGRWKQVLHAATNEIIESKMEYQDLPSSVQIIEGDISYFEISQMTSVAASRVLNIDGYWVCG
ncbi:hypothetical protein NQ318_004028 [Aromia moschata]|uniref:Uncharacterized protein n=1 Tax=Aromia moschata TaxID=1265417 RepID=A0AAV8Z863_9CUCU|nr:hypothetical protein NQ318_004028 [Aromia moschata]